MKFYDLTFPRKEAKRAAVKRHGWDGMGRDGEREIVLRSLPLPLLYSLGRDGQKEGPFAQIRLTPRERYTSFRPSLAPEGGKGRKGDEHEDISWFVPSSILHRPQEESVSLTHSLARGRHYVRVVNNSRLDFFQHVYFLPAAVAENGRRRKRWSVR